MGMQAMNDADLRQLGRLHTAAEARAAFDIARTHFERVSFDLIYGRQGQTLADWQKELKEGSNDGDRPSFSLPAHHRARHGLRRSLRPWQVARLPDEDLGADLYSATQEICHTMGFPRYEVSNHARPGAESRHNLIYWRYGDYLGIGPGAHGRLTLDGTKYATVAYSNPARWLKEVAEGTPEKPREPLSRAERATEFLLMGLRLEEGIDPMRFEQIAGRPLDPAP